MNWKENILAVLYPARCPVCGRIPEGAGRKICVKCDEQLKPLRGSRCFKCSKPLHSEQREYCGDCSSARHAFKQGIAVYPYDKVLKKSIYQIKYYNKREYIPFFAERAAKETAAVIKRWSPDFMVPIPLHKKKQRIRGFNQAELLARGIGEKLGIQVRNDLLVRIVNTVPQKELTLKERQNNLKKAFKIVGNDVKLKKVLLVDDIYTTGSTIDAAAQALLDAGAKEVCFITLCIGSGGT